MSRRIAKLAMFVVLAFQLAFGLQFQAVAGTLIPHVTHANGKHCRTHAGTTEISNDGYQAAGNHQVAAAHDATGTHGETGMHDANGMHPFSADHDCCRSSGCQCHCASTPAAFHLQSRAGSAPSVAVPALCGAQRVPTPIDEFLRPPIG